MNNEQREKFIALQKSFGITPYVKPNIDYADDPKRLYSNHPYRLTLSLHPTDFDGLCSNEAIKKSDRYEMYMVYDKWSMRETIGPAGEGSTLTKEQVVEVLRIADKIIRGSDRLDRAQIKAIYEMICDVFVAVELREMRDKYNAMTPEERKAEADASFARAMAERERKQAEWDAKSQEEKDREQDEVNEMLAAVRKRMNEAREVMKGGV